VPVFGRDGSLMTTPGYHPEARVYYSPGPGLERMREVTGSPDDVREAVAWVRGTLFAEFPFVEDADFAHAVALFLLPFARDLIGGLTPMHSVIAPTPGSGKDALIDVALRPSCGTVGKTAEIKSDDEMRKQITAHLLAGTSAFVFDNIKTSLDSGALAAALTADVWKDRILGYSKTVSLPVRNVWALTANNLTTTTEQARRMVPIFLDANMDRPDTRSFKRDLDTWIPQHRADAVWAALTIIKSWLDADEPMNRDLLNQTFNSDAATFTPLRGQRLKNSYAEWSRVMGGILDWIEVPGFLDNCDKMFMYVEDEASDDLPALLAAWHTRHPEPLSTKELTDKLWEWNGGLIEYLPADLRDSRHEQRSNNLGQVLRHNADRVHGEYKIVKHDGRPRKWQVVKVRP
jgi:putative DNA primase/helicase